MPNHPIINEPLSSRLRTLASDLDDSSITTGRENKATIGQLQILVGLCVELAESVEGIEKVARSAANTAGCLANGICPD